jgi:hypothetical protein
MKIYNLTNYKITDVDDDLWNYWIQTNNSRITRFATVPPQPTYNPLSQELVWDKGQWQILEKPPIPERKVWPNSALFLNEFTFEEQMAIASSNAPDIRALSLVLAVWPGELWSNDYRLQTGMKSIVQKNIIPFERVNNILAPTGLLN